MINSTLKQLPAASLPQIQANRHFYSACGKDNRCERLSSNFDTQQIHQRIGDFLQERSSAHPKRLLNLSTQWNGKGVQIRELSKESIPVTTAAGFNIYSTNATDREIKTFIMAALATAPGAAAESTPKNHLVFQSKGALFVREQGAIVGDFSKLQQQRQVDDYAEGHS